MFELIYWFWFLLVCFPVFFVGLLYAYWKIQTRRTLKLGIALSLLGCYGLFMATIATTIVVIFRIDSIFPPRFELLSPYDYCSNPTQCIFISNDNIVFVSFILIFMLGLGSILLIFVLAQFILGILWYSKIQQQIDPIASEELSKIFSKNTGLPLNNITIAIINTSKFDAYSFSVVPIRKFYETKHYIVISTAFTKLLTKNELIGVVAHEYAHIYNQDTYWLPLMKLFEKIFFFDILLHYIRNYFVRKIEFRADEQAAVLTQKPAHLASALLKVYETDSKVLEYTSQSNLVLLNLLGKNKNKELLLERVERLLNIDISNSKWKFEWPKW